MFSELSAKINSAKTYCLSKCTMIDPVTGKTVPDPEAVTLYNTAFASLNTSISNYKASIDFNAVFRCVTGIYTALVTTIDPDVSSASSLWTYFGGDVFNEMIETEDEDWFTTTTDTNFVDSYIMKVTVAISGDKKARDDLGMTITQDLNISIFKSFFDDKIEIPKQTPTDEDKIRMIFEEGKLTEIIHEYGLDEDLIPPYAHPNETEGE